MQMATIRKAQVLQSGDVACLEEQVVNEQELVCAARFGDTHAFSCLVHRYQGFAYNLAYRMLGDSQSAGDAAQDAFLSAFRAIGQCRGQSFKPWILRIVANKCYDRLRYRQQHPEDSLECLSCELERSAPLTSKLGLPENYLLRQELCNAIQWSLLALPAEQRAAIVLADILDCNYGAIAEITGASVGTVKSRIYRGRMRLRYLLSARGQSLPAPDPVRKGAKESSRTAGHLASAFQEGLYVERRDSQIDSRQGRLNESGD
jgi:RNA polymerase sigma-70 factor (ECF subfamily)